LGFLIDATAPVEAASGTLTLATNPKRKSKLALIAALCALAFPMTFAGDETKPAATTVGPGNEAARIEERLIEADIAVTLEHYSKVRAVELEEEFHRIPEKPAKGEEKEWQEQGIIRRVALGNYIEELRRRAKEYGPKLQKLRDARAANSSSGK
jgi:hypothetical protein